MSNESPMPSKRSAPGAVRETSRPSVEWIVIDAEQAGQRLDNFLMGRLRGAPRSLVYRIIRKGEVRINRSRARPDSRLAAGDEVRVPPVKLADKAETVAPGARVLERIEAAVVHEDAHFLIVNKPSGLAVHGGSGLQYGLIEGLRASRPAARFLELVHRIDRDTSGLIMVAKKRSALRHLQDQIREKKVEKGYHALVSGRWSPGVSRIDVPLLRDELRSGERIVRVAAEGKAALTRFRVLEVFTGYSLVEAVPVTGRTHQIRVHCAFAGHPIAGDPKYMDDASRKAFRNEGGRRLMLHAASLGVAMPGSGERRHFSAPYDEAFEQFVLGLRK
jgi:23S rRNA pseudouridine955/2504/2580 synthase